ncbi:type II toxin-antitoxin system PemK/MazF family toxin [Streptomyces sp. NPDC052496]|uniref:type II toxin-antitoxin system PemK/MazF family toxin n=1 Tax=Streptomyces sp. NPDC052496 TaxID=3154951 RepID=UPI003421CF5C
MDLSRWWPALAVVAALALVAALVDGRARARGARRRQSARFRPRARARGRTRPGGHPPRVTEPGARTPRAREIWWALVPYEDGPGGKDRPCLVLSVRGGTAQVAKITSRYHPDRPGVLPLPPGTVGDGQGRASFLETDELRDVPLRDFRRRAGTVDAALWKRVRRLTGR